MAASGTETDTEGDDGGEQRWDWWRGVTTAMVEEEREWSRLAEEEDKSRLALVLQEVKMTDNKLFELLDTINSLSGVKDCNSDSLHLFIDGREICAKDCHYFIGGANHVLLCDLRVLFSDEEWK
ncbi:TMV resistance protein N-like, partial [Trifolium medium]|nr:TMV resistance protein N-like [Trifolium medium]